MMPERCSSISFRQPEFSWLGEFCCIYDLVCNLVSQTDVVGVKNGFE